MSDNKFSVDDILQEIHTAKNKKQHDDPKSDMNNVNDIIEQILLEKKNKELKENHEALSLKERELLEKEIKLQTRNIAKLYEKAQKDETRRLKKMQRSDIEFAKGLSLSTFSDTSFSAIGSEFEKQLAQSMKLTTIHPDQSIKLTKPIDEVTQSLPNKQKIDSYVQSAHLDHIKREAMNITAHFGIGKEEVAQSNVINVNSYRKYKKSRDEKIGSFVLDSAQNPNETKAEDVSPPTESVLTDFLPTDVTAAHEENAAPISKKHVYKAEIDSSYVIDEESYSLETDDDKEKLATMLHKKLLLKTVSTVGLLLLTICAFILMFAQITPQGITLFSSIVMEPTYYLNLNLILIVVALVFSMGIFKNSFMSIITREPSRDILYLTTSLVCVASIVMLMLDPKSVLKESVQLFTPVLIISLFFNSLSRLIVARQALQNLDFILGEDELYSITLVDDDNVCEEMTKGIVEDDTYVAKNVKLTNPTNFIENTFKSEQSDAFCAKLCIFILPVALILGIAIFLLTKNIYTSLTIFSCIMALSTTFIGGLLVAFPLFDTSKLTERFSGMAPCVNAIADFENTNAVLIDACDMFPKGTIKLMGIKTFSGKRIDNAIVDASSVLCECKSALSHVFLDVIANDKSLLKPVDSILYEDLMGISAWVDNKRVLIGNRDLMINHSIAVPKKEYEEKYNQLHQDIVYIAAEGELCAAFILGVTTKKGIYDSMNMLKRNDIKIIIKSVDALFTPERIASVFKIEIESFKILASRLHRQFLEEHTPQKKHPITIGNNGTILGYLISLVTTKKLSTCVLWGVILNTFSIILGIILVLALFLLGHIEAVTSLNITLYLLLFSVIYWIVQKNTHI